MKYNINDRVIVQAYRWNLPMCGIITEELFSDPNNLMYKVLSSDGHGYFRSNEMTIDKQYYRDEIINELGL